MKPNTKAQKEAARANGAKSRGPITPEGKARVSRNAETHGMLTGILIEGEDPERFAALLARMIDEHRPVSHSDFDAIENLAVARWRQLRIWGIESESLSAEIHAQAAASPLIANAKPAARAAAAWRALADHSQTLQLARRYESACERQYARALSHFRDAAEKENCQTNPASGQLFLFDNLTLGEKKAK